MRVLVACEFSGTVRDAFARKGHDAWSCDLLPTEVAGNHIQDDVLLHLTDGWDLMIAHPPCTYLTCAGSKWYGAAYTDRFPDRQRHLTAAAQFFIKLTAAPIARIAIENPVGRMSSLYRKPDQIIQPFWFGHDVRKSTCLWLKNLPLLVPTLYVSPVLYRTRGGNTMSKWHVDSAHLSKEDRTRVRSITFTGVAQAMADQWGSL